MGKLYKKDPEKKRNSSREKSIPHEEPKDTNIVGNITKLLPGNTFLMFQMLAPVATNDGHCGRPETIMTSAMLIILASTCMLVCFTDTIQFKGKVYHGLVTSKGLWNPSFRSDPSFTELHVDHKPEKSQITGPYLWNSTYSSGSSQYRLNFTDFLHAVLSAMAFGTLTMLTNPVIKCFYPKISVTVVKTLPLLAGFVISGIFAFSPPARNGIAHPLSPKVHGPSLPSKSPGKGDHDHANSMPDVDDLDGFVKKYLEEFLGSPDHEKGKSGSPTEHQQLQDGVKPFASRVFSKCRDIIKHRAETIVHSSEGEAKRETNQFLHKAAPAVGELDKDIHVSALVPQEPVKSVPHDALVAGLVNAGKHPALAVAAAQSTVQDAEDAALTQMHQELPAATSGPLAGLSKQSSMALSRENSMLQSSGSSLPSDPNAPFHQAAQVLQRQGSGLSPNVQAAGSEAEMRALASRLLQAAYQLPGTGQSPQATALNAFTQNFGNQLILNAANHLMKDANSLVQQGSKSLTEIIHEDLARQRVAMNSQMQPFYFPSSSDVQSKADGANFGSHTLSQGTFAATVAAGAAREAGTLLLEGANHGMAGVHAEIVRQKVAAVQSIAQPATSLVQDTASRGSHSWSDGRVELLKKHDAKLCKIYYVKRKIQE